MIHKPNHVFILAAKRTPIGRFQGVLRDIPAPKLGATVLQSIFQSASVEPENCDEVFMGQVLTAGVGQAPARQAWLYAGFPSSVPATTVGKVCGSGLQSVSLGVRAIQSGESHVVAAGGQENMSLAPYMAPQARDGFRMGHKQLIDSMIYDGLWDPYNNIHMGNCAEACAKKYEITRKEQDEYAKTSYELAQKAIKNGFFANEICPVLAGKEKIMVQQDEEPFAVDINKMDLLKPAFDKEGTITAGNASKINDGAAAVLLASSSFVSKSSSSPLARVVATSVVAQEPFWFTTAPGFAIEKVLKKAELSLSDIDFFEINEAFSVVSLAAIKQLNIPREKINIHGGACALGHPIGASGARLLTTLIHSLHRYQKKYGLVTLCIGGGEAIAMIIERV